MNTTTNHELSYFIDFELMPTLIHNGQGKMVDFLLKGAGAAFSSLYNKAWSTYASGKPFYTMDFLCRHIQKGHESMIYVTLPKTPKDFPMACTHMAVTYLEHNGKYSDVRVFHIERSSRGTTAIGEMQVGEMGVQAHLNYGSDEKSDEQNIEKIWSLAFFERVPHMPQPLIS